MVTLKEMFHVSLELLLWLKIETATLLKLFLSRQEGKLWISTKRSLPNCLEVKYIYEFYASFPLFLSIWYKKPDLIFNIPPPKWNRLYYTPQGFTYKINFYKQPSCVLNSFFPSCLSSLPSLLPSLLLSIQHFLSAYNTMCPTLSKNPVIS